METMQRKLDRIYIFSNSNPHKTTEEYRKALSDYTFGKNGIIVFMNKCVPYITNMEIFTPFKKIVFYRLSSKGYIGSDTIGLFNKERDTIKYICRTMEKHLNINDKIGYVSNVQYPDTEKDDVQFIYTDVEVTNKEWGYTTGFLCYKYFSQYFKDKDIVLVNFCVNDIESEILVKYHNFKEEKDFYIRNNVNMIKI